MLIQANQLTRVYKNGEHALCALDRVTLSVERGAFVSVIGSSGSGKSTLLHLLGGIDQPTGGTVTIDGTDLYSLAPDPLTVFRRRYIGFVFQNYSLIKHLRVWENIELPLLYAKKALTKKQRHEMITDLLKSVGLENKGDDYPINLSGGEQQRVAIARALSVSPEAILCDEPTGALDKRTGTQIMELLHSVVKENGIMLLLVTHDPDIADTCDTIFEMDGGRITYAENDT